MTIDLSGRPRGTLEVLGWDEFRGVFVSPGGKDLVPGNAMVILHLRVPGGAPFSVTVDGAAFDSILFPALEPSVHEPEDGRSPA
jgi:hypothetical protein